MRALRLAALLPVALAGFLALGGLGLPVSNADDAAKVAWAASYEAAIAAAQKSGKPVLVDVSTDWCGYCAKMDEEVFPNPKIVELSREFEPVKVDAEKRKDLADKYKVDGFPTYLFLDAKGQVVYRTDGYMPAEPFGVRLKTGLAIYKAGPELSTLQVKRGDGKATPEELARLGNLLLQAGQSTEAGAAVEEALLGLAKDSPARAGAELDKLLAGGSAAQGAAGAGLEAWIAANPQHARKWEAQYELGIAQANGDALVPAAKTLSDVVAGAPGTDWAVLATYQGGIIDEIINRPKTGG